MSEAAITESDVVCNNNEIQTVNAKWLRIKNIYLKLVQCRDYDIGGTYASDALEYWFLLRTDQLGDNYLLHLFIANRHESSYCVEVSGNSNLTYMSAKSNCTHSRSILSTDLKIYNFNNSTDNMYNLVTTFSFDSYDLHQLRDKELFIPIRVSTLNPGAMINNVKSVKLKHDLSALLRDPLFSDFTIESFEECQFKVHRSVLIAQSEVFRAMLKQNTAESQKNVVRLHFNKEEIEQMLEYIYTGTVSDMTKCDCVGLLVLADHYNLPGLSLLAQNAICSQINENNVMDIFNVANMHNCQLLKDAAFKYIKINTEKVIQHDSWKSLDDPALLKQIITLLNNK